MWMLNALRWLLAVLLALILLSFIGAALHALWLARVADPPEPADLIIVLGGDMTRDSTLGPETSARVDHAAELFRAGLAPRVHFTGGIPQRGQDGAGDQMRAYAATLGVPLEASSAENYSYSTLQNALLSEPILGPLTDGSIILVSDGYHLARSLMSFRWAGYDGPIQLSAATAFGDRTRPSKFQRLLREASAWWFNLARMAAWHVLEAAGASDDLQMRMLR